MDYFPFHLIKGRRDARLIISDERVSFRDWCLKLGARVGVEPEETESFLSMKLKCGMALAKEFKCGRLEKHQLLLVKAVRDSFCNAKALAKDGSTAFDRTGLLVVDVDKQIEGYTAEEMKRELQTFLHYPVVTSPSGNLKIFVPILIKEKAPWNYYTRMVVIEEFLNRFLPPELVEGYWNVVDRSHSSSRVFFANEEILLTLLEYQVPLSPLVLEPISDLYEVTKESKNKDRSGWVVPPADPQLSGILADLILAGASADKTIAPKYLQMKVDAFEKDPKVQKWISKYEVYLKERMKSFDHPVDLTKEHRVRAVAYGKGFFTKLADYMMIIQIMISQPALDHERSIQFFQEVLQSRDVGFEKPYIHKLIKEIEGLGLIEKTAKMERHQHANRYRLLEPLETFYYRNRPEVSKELELPEEIPDGHWNEVLWKCSSKFRTFDSFFGWAINLPGFESKKNRLWHVVGAWNSSIKSDLKRDSLGTRESVLIRIREGVIVKESLLPASA